MKIAGKWTANDWHDIKTELNSANPPWEIAFTNFFLTRLETRYLNPIHLIQTRRENTGEGFSIVSLQCALIEFLQTTRDGINFDYSNGTSYSKACKGTKNYTHSGGSKKIFAEFLQNQEPFNSYFDSKEKAEDFFSNVRCSLLHEARTTGNWRIKAKSKGSETIKVEDGITFLQRDHFQRDLEAYIWRYKNELLSDTTLQEAFIRKFNALCVQ